MKSERQWPVPGGRLCVAIEGDNAAQLMEQVEECVRAVVRGEWQKLTQEKAKKKGCGCGS